jgi:hypothetical protein
MINLAKLSFFVFETWAWPYRDRFRLFVPKRYCVPTRSFLGVPDRSPFLTVHRSWQFTVPDRSPSLTVLRSLPFTVPGRSTFLTVHRPWPFTVPDRSPFLTVHRSWPFTVPHRSSFLTVHRSDHSWAFISVRDRSWAFLTVSRSFLTVPDRFMSLLF